MLTKAPDGQFRNGSLVGGGSVNIGVPAVQTGHAVITLHVN